ncbi:AAA family ATPase [Synechococcales cyanobacterium C]|uniref:AAA family ATPase n=1 Tax=Petrachloros mirabilis ULC683 TaxID=2781853 RepID=A0A8K1ZZZ6_9CYAN|nr:AAA family ATPase [Petrachloros mirabilis]NCJ07088.1 AAA family ATPase [Petrachloros mirabilis ULC683]
MSTLCHFLIGPPACGKSTFAQAWVEQDPNRYAWISTDQIRADRYGDALI